MALKKLARLLLKQKRQLFRLFVKKRNRFWNAYLESTGIKYKPQNQKVFFGDKDLVEN